MSKLTTKTYMLPELTEERGEAISKADLIVKSFCDLPRSQIRALFQNNCVHIDGRTCVNPGTVLKPGQELKLEYEEGRKYKEKRQVKSDSYDLVFEDGHIIVINKKAGVLTVPTRSGTDRETLVDIISNDLPSGVKLHVVHRLDRDTSGLLVFAKSFGNSNKLKEQFENRKPERIYDAFVVGEVKPEKGSFESYMATDEDLNQYSVKNPKKGKLAVTHYHVHEYFKGASWVKVKLETGRRNQIRVHFSENGYPVLGDLRYKPEEAKHPAWKEDYLALHASTLSFRHPVSNKVLNFSSDLPDRMKRFIGRLKGEF